MRIKLICLILVCITFQTFAQTDPFTFQHFNNPYVLNPARSGDIKNANARLYFSHKKLWDDLDGKHTSQIVTLDNFIQPQSLGIGILFFKEDVHITSFQGLQISAAKNLLKPEKNMAIRIGINGGINTTRLDLDDANIRDLDDPILISGELNNTKITAGFGFALDVSDKLKFDLAYQHFAGKRIASQDQAAQYQRRWNIFTAYDFMKKGSDKDGQYYIFQPSLISRFYIDNIKELGVNMKHMYYTGIDDFEYVWVAVGYRTQPSREIHHLNFSIGADFFQRVSTAIHYDTALGVFANRLSGTLELQLGLKFR